MIVTMWGVDEGRIQRQSNKGSVEVCVSRLRTLHRAAVAHLPESYEWAKRHRVGASRAKTFELDETT